MSAGDLWNFPVIFTPEQSIWKDGYQLPPLPNVISEETINGTMALLQGFEKKMLFGDPFPQLASWHYWDEQLGPQVNASGQLGLVL